MAPAFRQGHRVAPELGPGRAHRRLRDVGRDLTQTGISRPAGYTLWPVTVTAVETPRVHRGPRRGRRVRFFLVVLTIAIAMQVPLLWALGRLTGQGGGVVAVAGALTVAFLSGLLDRAAMGDPSPRRLYLVMWPFFVYWTAALFFAFLGPLVLGVGALLSAPVDASLGAALAGTAALTLLAFIHRVRIVRRDVPISSLPEAF